MSLDSGQDKLEETRSSRARTTRWTRYNSWAEIWSQALHIFAEWEKHGSSYPAIRRRKLIRSTSFAHPTHWHSTSRATEKMKGSQTALITNGPACRRRHEVHTSPVQCSSD